MEKGEDTWKMRISVVDKVFSFLGAAEKKKRKLYLEKCEKSWKYHGIMSFWKSGNPGWGVSVLWGSGSRGL